MSFTDVSAPYDPWFAIHVRSRQERIVSQILSHKGFEEFLPLYEVQRRWSDRIKWIEQPLFPGYLFCRLDPRYRLPVLTIPGVVSIVKSGGTLIPVDSSEVEAIQRVVQSGFRVDRWSSVTQGQPVEIEDGPLCGVRGVLVEFRRQQRLLVSVTILQRTVAVEIERSRVRPLSRNLNLPYLPNKSAVTAGKAHTEGARYSVA